MEGTEKIHSLEIPFSIPVSSRKNFTRVVFAYLVFDDEITLIQSGPFYQEVHMRITINGEAMQIAETILTIARLLEIKRFESPAMVSVVLNDEIIDRAHYETIKVSDNDAIEFLYFMGGGAG